MREGETARDSAISERRRSARAHQAILQATMALLKQVGYGALTIEGIAAQAGVGKKTIYRWWPSKAAVALEALTTFSNVEVPFPDTGSLHGDLNAYFERSLPALQSEAGVLLRGLVAEAQLDPAFGQDFVQSFIFPRKRALLVVLERGRERGELAGVLKLDVLADMIYGAIWGRLLLQTGPLDGVFVRDMVALIEHFR